MQSMHDPRASRDVTGGQAGRISAAEAAARLGVKRETLYAYVSRGLLESRRLDGKTSTFDPAEVDALRQRRNRPKPGRLDTAIVSSLTEVRDHAIRVRGHDLVELARDRTPYETVASLLWTGTLAPTPGWERNDAVADAAAAVQAALPAPASLIDRIRANVVAASAADPLRRDVRRAGVLRAAAPLVAAMVDGLPGAAPRGPLAARLWPALARSAPTLGWASALNAALVLLADHDLAASTLAARIAASTRADPYSVVLAGLGVFAGAAHGGASGPVHELLQVAATDHAGPVVAERLATGEHLAGFGHFLYPDGDPRAIALLELVRGACDDERRLATCEQVLDLARTHIGVEPNVDFAIAALTFCAGMPRDAGEAIFAIARTAGWIAHALEELDEQPLRFRPVTRYVGP